MSNTSIQTRAEVAKILDRVKIDCSAVSSALARTGNDYKVIGRVFGDHRYLGRRKMAEIKVKFPSFEFIVLIARGRTSGTSEFAVYAKK